MTAPIFTGKCFSCEEPMWATRGTFETYYRNHKTFYCIHGHPQRYVEGKSKAQKLQEQLDEERRVRQRAEQRAAYLEDDRDAAYRQASAFKGQATRLRNRAKAGVCPCCNRTFKQLAAHMATKHPAFQVSVE